MGCTRSRTSPRTAAGRDGSRGFSSQGGQGLHGTINGALRVLVGRLLHEPGGLGDNDTHTLDRVVLYAFAVPILRGGLNIAGGVCRAAAQFMFAGPVRMPLDAPCAPRVLGDAVAHRCGMPGCPAV